jgi:hypothetical protein
MNVLCETVRTFGKAQQTKRINGVFANDRPKKQTWAADAAEHYAGLLPP